MIILARRNFLMKPGEKAVIKDFIYYYYYSVYFYGNNIF